MGRYGDPVKERGNCQEVQTLTTVGQNFKPLSKEEQNEVIDRFLPYAARLAYYRGTL